MNIFKKLIIKLWDVISDPYFGYDEHTKMLLKGEQKVNKEAKNPFVEQTKKV